MGAILLPLHFTHLNGLENRTCHYIEQAVELAASRNTALVISVRNDELAANRRCMDSIWEKVQAFLGTVYVVQLNKSYQLEKPLLNCHVVFEDICAYDVFLEEYITDVCITESGIAKIEEDWNTKRDKPLEINLLTDTGTSDRTNLTIEHTGPIEPLVFQRVAVGGTFDHLHAGHKILLTMTALLASKSMVVGVTDDCMLLKKKHRELIDSTVKRCQVVEEYLHLVKRDITYEVVPITDPFGPTVTDPTIDALVVSKETLKGGDLVNSERDMRGYPPLELRIIDVISSSTASLQEDMDILKISSSWIREYLASRDPHHKSSH